MAKRKNPVDELSQPMPFDDQRIVRQQKRANEELKASLAAAHQVIDRLEREKDLLLALDDRRQAAEWKRPKRVTTSEATGVLLLSDWHVEQSIRKGEVNGINEWNPTIADSSIREVFRRTVDIALPRYRQAARIDNLVVWLGGDLIEGTTRDEQKANNSMSPVEAMKFAEERLEHGIRYLLRHAEAKRIIVVTSTGNHDRMTDKLWATGRNDTSFATLAYDHLRKLFIGEKRIEWHASEGKFTYLDVYRYRCRFFHGDAWKFKGGIGGLSMPANRAIDRWDASPMLRADISFYGHWHNFHHNRPNRWVCNGCLPGTAPYSMDFGVSEPCQGFAVIDKNRGLTDAMPVFCR